MKKFPKVPSTALRDVNFILELRLNGESEKRLAPSYSLSGRIEVQSQISGTRKPHLP
jgi:hypothetical protein